MKKMDLLHLIVKHVMIGILLKMKMLKKQLQILNFKMVKQVL